MSGIFCDRKLSTRVKGKVYNTAIRPAMLYGMETVGLMRRQEAELEVAELRMLRFALGVTRLNKIKNTHVRGTANVVRIGKKVRETRLRWYGLCLRRNTEYAGKRVIGMDLPGKRRRGRPLRRYMGRSEGRLEGSGGLRRKMQKIGPNGGESSAVATPNGTSRKEKKKKKWDPLV